MHAARALGDETTEAARGDGEAGKAVAGAKPAPPRRARGGRDGLAHHGADAWGALTNGTVISYLGSG